VMWKFFWLDLTEGKIKGKVCWLVSRQ